MASLYMSSLKIKWIERPHIVWEVIGSIPSGTQVFSFPHALDMLIINFHFHICFTELKIYHLSFLSPHSAMSTLLMLAVCRTRVKYEPTKWPCSQGVLHSSSGEDARLVFWRS